MYTRLTTNLNTTQRRKEMLHGREHYVVPTAILAEGIISGSGGDIFYGNDQLSKWHHAWNHRPMVVYHPTKDDKNISACDPVVLNTCGVGITLNTTHGDKTITESWIDIERCRSVDNRIIDAIENGKPVEVSTGLELDLLDEKGEWNGKPYIGKAINHRPDHLAILPDKVGAYSVKDGGGMLACNERRPERTQQALNRSMEQALGVVGIKIVGNELSFSDVSCQLSDLLASKFGEPGKYWSGYICEVFKNRVVFETKHKCYQIGYTNDGTTVTLDGEAEEVERVVEYRTVGGSTYAGNESGQLVLKETAHMAGQFDKKAHIQGLIGNGYEEADRMWLEKMEDAYLQKIKAIPKEAPKPPVVNAEPPKLKKVFVQNDDGTFTEAPHQPQPKPVTLADLLANADPTLQEGVMEGVQAAAAERDRLVTEIMANGQNPFSKEFLMAKKLPELRGLATLARGTSTQQQTVNGGVPMFQANYLGAAGGPLVNTTGRDVPKEVLIPTDVEFASVVAK